MTIDSGIYKERVVVNMNEYIGKTCPYCKTEITSNDDFKVCPSCNMPHHQSCWDENNGCTTFG
ncbi:hypothetical protein AGMMS49975_29350 [Clostridia bacterium]|nr:hypothetical protein AGMMS49975_29350 [Clostridia bacterium]